MIDFWKSMTASHILAGARPVARKVTEGRRPKGDRGAKCRVKERTLYIIIYSILYCKPILRALSLLVCGL